MRFVLHNYTKTPKLVTQYILLEHHILGKPPVLMWNVAE